MPKSYKNQLLERIADYDNQIAEINRQIKEFQDEEAKRTFFQKLFGVKKDYSFLIEPLLEKRAYILKWRFELKEELNKGYIYGRRLFVKGTKYRENGDIPFLQLANIDDDDDFFDYHIVRTKNFFLIAEPTNQVDPNAIKVIVEGYFVGYIDRRYNRGVKKYLDNEKYIIEGEVIATGGSVTGDDFSPIRYDLELRVRKK